jgi:branched-chain amino acid transport system permease protein
MFDLKPSSRASAIFGAAAIVLALAAPLVVGSDANRHVLILICIYAALAQAWNILGGFTGQVSLGNAVFFGVGAYAAAVLFTEAGMSPWIGAPVGMGLAIILAVLIGYPVFRLGGHYFAIATIAIAEIALVAFINLDVVGGATGISLPLVRDAEGRPTDSLLLLQFNQSKLPYSYLALALLGVVQAVAFLIERSRIGYYLRAIKNDQTAAAAIGVPVARYKLYAMMISAACTALVGAFYAQYLLFVDPETVFALSLSVLIALVAILGGAGSLWGPILGALVLIPLSEFTRTALGGSGRAFDLVIYGLLIMLIAAFQPTGLIGLHRRFIRRRSAPSTLSLDRLAAAKSAPETD